MYADPVQPWRTISFTTCSQIGIRAFSSQGWHGEADAQRRLLSSVQGCRRILVHMGSSKSLACRDSRILQIAAPAIKAAPCPSCQAIIAQLPAQCHRLVISFAACRQVLQALNLLPQALHGSHPGHLWPGCKPPSSLWMRTCEANMGQAPASSSAMAPTWRACRIWHQNAMLGACITAAGTSSVLLQHGLDASTLHAIMESCQKNCAVVCIAMLALQSCGCTDPKLFARALS